MIEFYHFGKFRLITLLIQKCDGIFCSDSTPLRMLQTYTSSQK